MPALGVRFDDDNPVVRVDIRDLGPAIPERVERFLALCADEPDHTLIIRGAADAIPKEMLDWEKLASNTREREFHKIKRFKVKDGCTVGDLLYNTANVLVEHDWVKARMEFFALSRSM